MIAQAIGGEPIEALCLALGGPLESTYTTGAMTCNGWKSGHLGAVDDPPNYGEWTRARYQKEEGPDALKASVET